MAELLSWFRLYFLPFTITDVIDITVVALGVYLLLRLVRRTRAVQLIRGFLAVALVIILTRVFHLRVSHWILTVILQSWVIALIVLFQPELRLVVEQIGRGRLLRGAFRLAQPSVDVVGMINEVVRAARRLSEKKIGALIAIEREVGLNDIISTGRRVNGKVSGELLQTIFYPGTPMHDGGVVIQGDQVAAGMCLFPLTSRDDSPRPYGTRHRAAIGLSELTDAVVVIVSEETGGISLALEGRLLGNQSVESLKEQLLILLQPQGAEGRWWFWQRTEKSAGEPAKPPVSSGEGHG
jgi:diadenylate cyclase